MAARAPRSAGKLLVPFPKSDPKAKKTEVSTSPLSSLPNKMISYISNHTPESLIAISILGFAVAIERKLPTWSLVVPAIALTGGIVKKIVDCLKTKAQGTDTKDKAPKTAVDKKTETFEDRKITEADGKIDLAWKKNLENGKKPEKPIEDPVLPRAEQDALFRKSLKPDFFVRIKLQQQAKHIQAILEMPNWAELIKNKKEQLIGALKEFEIDESTITEIWRQFPIKEDLDKRKKLLAQKVSNKFQEYFLDSKPLILKKHAKVIKQVISDSHFYNSTEEKTTNKIFQAFQALNIPISVLNSAWETYPKEDDKDNRLFTLFKKVSIEDREYFSANGMFNALDYATFLRKALSNPKYWQDEIAPEDLAEITKVFQMFKLEYKDFKNAWTTDNGTKTLTTMLYEKLALKYVVCFTE